jgi:5-deoxy-glucuronate isomerase
VSTLLVHPHPADASGCVLTVTPQSAGWKYVGFQVYRLAPGQVIQCVVLSGSADVAVEGQRFDGIGGRSSVFEDAAPGAVYASAGARFTVTAKDAVELAVCSAPGQTRRPARLIAAADMGMEVRGTGTNTRHVRNILPQTAPADSLLIVEVITPGGHWSSYPPHKHDTDMPPREALEETYYHRLNPPQGFAFQRVYTDDRSLDETICVEDGDVVLVPRGYHPVGAPHGYDLYYLNVMAGPRRRWIFRNDPAHDWIARPP